MSTSGTSATKALPVILLVTATPIESAMLEEALREAYDCGYVDPKIKGLRCKSLGVIGEAQVYRMQQARKGTSQSGGSFSTVTKGIGFLRPQAVIYVGFAASIRDTKEKKRKIGDILVSDKLYLYEPQTEDVDGTSRRGPTVDASDDLLECVNESLGSWYSKGGAEVHQGVIASGDKLVNDPKKLAEILKHEERTIGIEMEGAGLYIAARASKVDWIMIKGISDWADGTKTIDDPVEGSHDERRRKAALNAARFTLQMIAQGGWGSVGRSAPTSTDATQGISGEWPGGTIEVAPYQEGNRVDIKGDHTGPIINNVFHGLVGTAVDLSSSTSKDAKRTQHSAGSNEESAE